MKAVDKTLEKKCGWAVLKRTAHSHFLLLAAANAALSWEITTLPLRTPHPQAVPAAGQRPDLR